MPLEYPFVPAMYELSERDCQRLLAEEQGQNLPSSTNIVNAETDASCRFTDHSTPLQSIVDTLNGVVFHAHQEARAELRMRRSGVEEGGRCMGEVPIRHEVLCLNDTLNIAAVDTDSHTHDHVLWSLCDLAINLE